MGQTKFHAHTEKQVRQKFLTFQYLCIYVYIVAYFLKARAVESEKQPLLANGSETTSVSRQWQRNRQRNDVRC
jgi:hypothetical protein